MQKVSVNIKTRNYKNKKNRSNTTVFQVIPSGFEPETYCLEDNL